MSNDVFVQGSSSARNKVSYLCAAYDSVMSLYGDCAHPMGGQYRHVPDYMRMAPDKSSRYESAIRREMLLPCDTVDDFFRMINDTAHAGVTERRMKERLRDAFDCRRKMPYDRHNIAMSIFETDGDTWRGLRKPFHTSNAENMRVKILTYRVGEHVNQSSLGIWERVPGGLNLCLTRLPENRMEEHIPIVSRLFYGILCKERLIPAEGLRIKVFMHTPIEFSSEGKDEFHLITSSKQGKLVLMPHVELPRMVDYLFHINHENVTRGVALDTLANDFRGFALRAM